jgi:hypothetical protein
VSPLATDAPLKPVFQWEAVSGAGGYELVVSRLLDLSSPVISKTGLQSLTSNSWPSDITLDYAAPYYWRVRAVTSSGSGAWSATGIFVTRSAPVLIATVTATIISTPLPPPPSQTTGVTLPAASQTVVTAVPPTTTGSPPLVPQISGETPEGVYYALAGGGAGVVLLASIILLARSGKKRLL